MSSNTKNNGKVYQTLLNNNCEEQKWMFIAQNSNDSNESNEKREKDLFLIQSAANNKYFLGLSNAKEGSAISITQ
jgi:hypothetical protein